MPVCKDFERPLSKDIVTEKSHIHTAIFIQKGQIYTKEPRLYQKTHSHTKGHRAPFWIRISWLGELEGQGGEMGGALSVGLEEREGGGSRVGSDIERVFGVKDLWKLQKIH